MLTDNARLVPAGPEDTDVLLALMRELYAYDQGHFEATLAAAALATCLADDTWARVWLVQVAGEAIGYLVLTFGFSLEYGGRDAIIDELYLRGAFRGQGLGSEVVNFAIEYCRANGIKALHLEVFDHNAAAYRFYRRQGFRERDSRFMSLKL